MSGASAAVNTTFNLGEVLRNRASRHPARPALVFPAGPEAWTTVPYGELDRRSDAIAHGLRLAGLDCGATTVLALRPGPDLFATLFALFKLGVAPVVVDAAMGLGRMLHCYRSVGADGFVGFPLTHLVRIASPRTFRSLRTVVTAGRRLGWGGETLDELERRGAALGLFPIAPTGRDDALLINFTTGSTGPAKPVVLTHGIGEAMVESASTLFGRVDGDVTLVTMPFMAVLDVLVGGTAVLAPMNPLRPAAADPARIAQCIERFSVAHLFGSPAFLHRLATWPGVLRSVRTVVAGGAPVNPALLRALRERLPPEARVETTYGATEGLPLTSIESREILRETAERAEAGLGTCLGRPVCGVEVRLLPVTEGPVARWAEAGTVAAGEIGEIVVRGPVVSPRYHQSPAADEAHKVEGWHRTGDLGWLDEAGRVWFAGRERHRVHTSERTLHSVQVEGVFDAHPEVYRTALVGVGAPATPVVCVELRPGVADPDRVLAALRERAAGSPVTRGIEHFLVHPGFPVDVRHNAKIHREELGAWASWVLHPPPWTLSRLLLYLIPVGGWIYILIGLFVPLGPVAAGIWWIDLFLSVVVHGLQLVAALPVGRRAGYSTTRTVLLTFLLGATWWKPLRTKLTP